MSNNSNLHKAKEAKNDEFYTRIEDIEKEMKHYKNHFKDKVVLCNCDDPEWSNFWKYFSLNFDFLGLKKLISTHYEKDKPSYNLEMIKMGQITKTPLKQNGDFRSPECIEILKEADIVVTNPPFSLFREYIDLLISYKKHFIIIGPLTAVLYKEIFPHIINNQIWLGTNSGKMSFKDENGNFQIFNNIRWFTNLVHNKRFEKIPLYKHYNSNIYPKYDKYDAIEVSKVCDIPCDYFGLMGVPITFMDKYNPEQFEVIGDARYITGRCDDINIVNGKLMFKRFIIKRKEDK